MAARRVTRLLGLGAGTGVLVMAVPSITPAFKVQAASANDCCEEVKIQELSLYDHPEPNAKYIYCPEKETAFLSYISEVRQFVQSRLQMFESTSKTLKEKSAVGQAHAEDFLDYLQNDPGMLPRVSVITIAGLGGIVAGYRGGVLRKLFYSATAATAAASLCYPNEAVAYSKQAYGYAKDTANELKANLGPKKACKPCPEEKPTPKTSTPAKQIKGDLGQSNPADKDMYTTRK